MKEPTKDQETQEEGKEIKEHALPVEEGEKEERVPIKAPLQVLRFKTINKQFGWWAAVVLLESYAKKQVCLYLWQKRDGSWKRKQKFGVHSKEDWQLMKNAVESFIGELT